MTKDAKETDITHGKYREKIKESLKPSPEELQHLKNEQKKRGTQKGVKRKGQRKRRKTRKYSLSTGCCRRAFFTRKAAWH